MKGSCVCGGVSVELTRRPDYINMCNCRLCRSTGGAYGYFAPGEFTISGDTRGFERDDLPEAWLTMHFCPRCGSATHWTPARATESGRIGVNVRLFPQEDLEGIQVRYLDGRGVIDETDEFVTTATGQIGDGKAF
jgi:hypothetical protein